MAWTYSRECADGTTHVGSTTDIERRVDQHNRGEGARYTRVGRRRPVTLVWACEFERIEDAFAFEKQVQGWSPPKRRALIDGRLDDLPELASRPRRGGGPG